MLNIRQAESKDIDSIQQIADAVWRPTYTPIIGSEQVAYMLNLFYSAEVIEEQLATHSQTYLLLEIDGEPIGFAAYSPRQENEQVYKLHKLYCLPNHHGMGYGRILLDAVEKETLSKGIHRLELNVNRHNPAKMFYEKLGYEIMYEEDIDIGNGYWMNDYVMGKDL